MMSLERQASVMLSKSRCAHAAEPVDTMLVYNITSDTWSNSTARLSSPRSDLCMAAVNGTLYAAGATFREPLHCTECAKLMSEV